jgi:DNA-binding NtrC family response regulator
MRNCSYCKKEFTPNVSHQRYCSKECADKYAVSLRRYGGKHYEVLERDNFTCKICGSMTDIVVHHRDHNIENNKMDNLISWCRPCHTSYHQNETKNNLYKHIAKDQIIKAINVTDTLEDAANVLGITRKTLMKKRLEYGLPQLSASRKGAENKTYKHLTINEINMAFELEGNWNKVATRLDVSPSFLRKRRRELGMEMDSKKTSLKNKK